MLKEAHAIKGDIGSARLRELILREEQAAEHILSEEFVLEQRKFDFILKVLAQQVRHTEEIMRLARDQAQDDRDRTIKALALIRKTIKQRQHNDFERELALRKEELANLDRQQRARVPLAQKPQRVRGIIESSGSMMERLEREVQILDGIILAFSRGRISEVEEGWRRLLGELSAEQALVGHLKALYAV